MRVFTKYAKLWAVIGAALMLFSSGVACGEETARSGPDLLLDAYNRHLPGLQSNNIGIPLIVESSEKDDRVHVDVYGVLAHRYSSVTSALISPAVWCDIISLYPNVKACTYRDRPVNKQVTLYLGSKSFQRPEDAQQIIFEFEDAGRLQGHLDIQLSAGSGPYGTRNHKIHFEALAIGGERTFVHVTYSYSSTVALRLASKIYFATFGRDKTGFSITGTDEEGKPQHIRGPRGAVERNAVRCYFAIQACLNSLSYPADKRTAMRNSDWYDITTRHKQLVDMDKKEYLRVKSAEHGNQIYLQQQVGSGHQ
jgi:hypothetical protein